MPKHLLSCALLLSLLLLAPHADRGGAPHARQYARHTQSARPGAANVAGLARGSAATVPAPEDVLGFRPGDDRKLAAWAQVGRVLPPPRRGERPRAVRGAGQDDAGRALRARHHQRAREPRAPRRVQRDSAPVSPTRARSAPRADRDAPSGSSRAARPSSSSPAASTRPRSARRSHRMLIAHRLASSDEPEVQRDPREHHRPARPVAQPRRRGHRQALVRPHARHALRGHEPARALSQVRRPRQQPRLVRLHAGRDAAHRRQDSQRLAPADRPRHPPAGRERLAPLPPALHAAGRAERARTRSSRATPSSATTWPTNLRDAGLQGHHVRLDLRRMDSGARLLALPRRRPHPLRDGLGHASPRPSRSSSKSSALARGLRPAERLRPTSPPSGPAASGICATSPTT